MKTSTTKIIDLYTGFEGENGYFFEIKNKDGLSVSCLKTWGGYLENIIYENPHVEEDGWHGLTKLFHEDKLNDVNHPLDNFLLVKDLDDLLNDLVWYKTNRYNEYTAETKLLLDNLIEIIEDANKNNYEVLIACDED